MTRARERLLLSGALELPARPACDSANGSAISWLAPALFGDLDELQELPPDAGLEGTLRQAAAGGAPLLCLLATPQSAAQLVPPAPERGAVRGPGGGGAEVDVAQAGVASPQRSAGRAASGRVHPAQLTLDVNAPAPAPRDPPEAPTGESGTGSVSAAALQTLSYSSLKQLERCGYRYYLERVLGMEERPQADGSRGARGRGALDPLSRGSLVHSVLELHDFGGGQNPSEQDVELAARGLGLRPGGGELRAIAGLLATALREQPAQRIAAAAEVWREHPFSYPAGEQLPLLTGVIDVLAREQDGGYLVLDYKSDPVGDGDDLEALVARDYALQRELYALAVLRNGAPRVEVQHWFLARPHEWASARFTAAELPVLQGSLEERLRRALASGFAVSPRPHRGLCGSCPGRTRLCSWPESATLAPEPAPAGGGG